MCQHIHPSASHFYTNGGTFFSARSILGPQESPVPSLGLFNLSMFSTGLKIHPLVPPGMITVQQEADQQVKFSHSITQLQFSSSSQGGHPEDET